MSGALSQTVWVTKTGASATTHNVPGYKALYHPLLEIAPPESAPPAPGHDDVLVFTSVNGVEAFCALTVARHWHVYTVGDATADAAHRKGFKTVQSAGRDVDALTAMIIAELPKKTPLYYASAKDVSGDLEGKLGKAGYTAHRAICYQTRQNTELPSQIPSIILLYSAKGAAILADSGLDLSRVHIISISETVDCALGKTAAKSRKIAEIPTHAGMIKQLS